MLLFSVYFLEQLTFPYREHEMVSLIYDLTVDLQFISYHYFKNIFHSCVYRKYFQSYDVILPRFIFDGEFLRVEMFALPVLFHIIQFDLFKSWITFNRANIVARSSTLMAIILLTMDMLWNPLQFQLIDWLISWLVAIQYFIDCVCDKKWYHLRYINHFYPLVSIAQIKLEEAPTIINT